MTSGCSYNIKATIEELARYEDEGWNDPVVPKEERLDYENPDLKQVLGVMECKVGTLMEKAISLMGRKERVKQLEEYMGVIGSDFMQLSLKVVEKLKDEIRVKENKVKKIEKITRYPDTEDPKPSSNLKFSKTLAKSTSFYAPDFISPKSLCVKYVRTIFLSLPLVYKPPMTYLEEIEETIGIPMEVEPLDHTKLEDLGLNTCSHDIFLSSKEVPSVDELNPQLLPNFSPLDVNLGDKRGTDPPSNHI
ncbi:hypothetical protein Tco_1454325, partial [Tanacetum coccineum]